MFLPYLLVFYRVTIGLIFTYSFLAKLRDGDQFTRTITDFKLLPGQLSKPAAAFVLTGELATVVMIIKGGQSLPMAFSLATFLLLVHNIGNLEDEYAATITATSGPLDGPTSCGSMADT